MATAATRQAGPHWPGWLLGFALGGFFDGILLHQLLQWNPSRRLPRQPPGVKPFSRHGPA